MDRETALSDLKSVCAVISEPNGSVPARYITPYRGEVGAALAVVAPCNLDEVRGVISFAIENKLRILPQGERTGLVGASVPGTKDVTDTIVMTMERFRNRLEYIAADRRVIVDAGYTLDEVNNFLKDFGVHIPIDVSSNPMIGGAVATNIGGSRVVHFGDARKLLLGVEVVLADEDMSLYTTLKHPRKDNSSPNFTGVFCGSFGTYGVITCAAFETFPLFTQTYTAWISVKKTADIADLLKGIEHNSGELLLACEFVSSKAIEAIAQFEELTTSLPFSDSKNDVVFIEWGTVEPNYDIEVFAEKFLEEISQTDFVDDVAIVPPAKTWELRHQFSDAIKKMGKVIGNDVSVPRDKVSELRHEVEKAVENFNPDLVVRDFGHLGDGGLHLNVLVENQQTISSWNEDNSDKIRMMIAKIAVELGGSFSAEHGLGAFNTKIYESLVDPVSKELAAKFKKTCDPQNVLGHSGIVFGAKEN